MKRSGDVVTLNYTEVPYINQPLATRTENVNPFAVITWIGGVELNPNSDVWLNERQLDSNVVDIDAGFTQAMQQLAVDPNTGLAPIQWGGWEEVWSSVDIERNVLSSDVNTVVQGSNTVTRRRGQEGHPGTDRRPARITTTQFVDEFIDTVEETITIDRGLTRSGIQFQVNESIDTQSLGNKLVSSELIPFMRSRNIEFVATRVQPRTQFYTFFDGQEVN